MAIMRKIGLPVPAFYTIPCYMCNDYFANGNKWPAGLKEMNAEAVQKLEKDMNKTFYSNENLEKFIGKDYKEISNEEFMKRASKPEVPTVLLFSVRSGAVQSMPGMMDTVLNLGLNDYSWKILAAKNPTNERYVQDSYRRFIMMFSDIVMQIDIHHFEMKLTEIKKKYGCKEDTELTAAQLKEVVEAFKHIVKETGKDFPQDTNEQLFLAINAVFASWNNTRAVTYRNLNKLPHDGGTAVSVVSMVFGNMNNISGSGVGFTRDPKFGAKPAALYGEFLKNAQGEDVVSGVRTPINIAMMKDDTVDNGIW